MNTTRLFALGGLIAALLGSVSLAKAQSVRFTDARTGQAIGSYQSGQGVRVTITNTSKQRLSFRTVVLTGSYPQQNGYVSGQYNGLPSNWWWWNSFTPSYYSYAVEVDEWVQTGYSSGYWYPITSIFRFN